MITNKEVIAWLKGADTGPFYNSCIDKDLDACVGIYSRRNPPDQPTTIGTESSWGIKSLTILVHWTKNADTCEVRANELWNLFRLSGEIRVGDTTGYFIAQRAPVDVGRDEREIFERTFDVDLIFRR